MGAATRFAVNAARKAAKAAADKAEQRPLSVLKRTSARTVRPADRVKPEKLDNRKKEAEKLRRLEVRLEDRTREPIPEVSIYDMEGEPFITSMSDLSAAGSAITGINDVELNSPVSLRGGQDYMFDNPNSVWASDKNVIANHVDLAQALKRSTGKDPLLMPWAMSPSAIDFAHMPREAMLKYAAAAMSKKEQRGLAQQIQEVIPDFRSMDDPDSIDLFLEAQGKRRGSLNKLLDLQRDRGGIGIGEARLATTDLDQLDLPLTSLRNVGRIEADAPMTPSSHPSYRSSLAGEGVGRLKENIGALQLLPDLMKAADLDDPFGFPRGVVPGVKSPMRSLQMAPKGGVITDKLLRKMEEREKRLRGSGFKRGGLAAKKAPKVLKVRRKARG